MKMTLRAWLVFTVLLTACCTAHAQQITIHAPTRIAVAGDSTVHIFTLQDALKMPQETMRTSTNWTDEATFKGVSFRAVLKKLWLDGRNIHFICYDGYDYRIPMSDVAKYNLLLAYERDGKRLEAKTLGPFALIYPRSEYPKELGGPEIDAKFIWMIREIYIE